MDALKELNISFKASNLKFIKIYLSYLIYLQSLVRHSWPINNRTLNTDVKCDLHPFHLDQTSENYHNHLDLRLTKTMIMLSLYINRGYKLSYNAIRFVFTLALCLPAIARRFIKNKIFHTTDFEPTTLQRTNSFFLSWIFQRCDRF